MATKPAVQQFILLPARGLRAGASASGATQVGFLRSMAVVQPSAEALSHIAPEAPGLQLRVLDSIHEDGAKLVEMSPEAVPALRAYQPGVRLVPVVYYRPAVAPRLTVESAPKAAAGRVALKIKLQIISRRDGHPLAGSMLVAFIDFANRVGAQGITNNRGEVSLALGASSRKLERLYVYPAAGFWGALRKNVVVTSGTQIALDPVDLTFTDGLRFFYGNSPDEAGGGVKVAVIDTGIAAHPDLNVDGGVNTVVGEDPNDFGDNGEHHGTHVAGIIAARGMPPAGLRGLAPAVTLRSYRVFPQNSGEASNYSIAKAIDAAVADGCDLINMSLGGGEPDEATRAAIEDARARGSLAIVAAGNDDRSPVSFPASDSAALAVSATGRKGTFPRGSTESGDVAPPYGTDRKNFIAAFSNVGPQIDLTGPGVGILSTVPGGYTPMSGTSMACPAVTGAAAKLLSTRADVLGLNRDQARSDAMMQALLRDARALGFGPTFEGQGLPR
jgi:subtilisin